jgi:hypothetical protein
MRQAAGGQALGLSADHAVVGLVFVAHQRATPAAAFVPTTAEEREGAELEGQWHERREVGYLPLTFAPCSNEVGDARVPAGLPSVQRTRRASLVLGPSRIMAPTGK